MLENHLEQIALSAQSIGDLQFPPPKIFTNAILGNHEITTLIRDTEHHERALFSLDPSAVNVSSHLSRRTITFPGSDNGAMGRKSMYASAEPRKQSAVARVLGTDMLQEIRRSSGNVSSRNESTASVNVEVLLIGAERLCAVYAVSGASEKIASLRSRYRKIAESIVHHEEKVAKQQTRLNRLNKPTNYGQAPHEEEVENAQLEEDGEKIATEQDLEAEEQEIRELEARKSALEDRVSEMKKDLGGLLR